ncbi:MAG: HAD family hydrolase, partial [Gemmatimonadetes bacterium]|nr:HAD family hydrolase [Gemmatimonadota bacterium]
MPKPLAELAKTSAADLVGVIFDIDDTVTRDGRLEAAAFSAMHELAASGLRLIAVTGRPLGWSDVAAHLWPVEMGVGENGAGWAWRVGATMHHGYYQSDAERMTSRGLLDEVRQAVETEMPE